MLVIHEINIYKFQTFLLNLTFAPPMFAKKTPLFVNSAVFKNHKIFENSFDFMNVRLFVNAWVLSRSSDSVNFLLCVNSTVRENAVVYAKGCPGCRGAPRSPP